MAEFEPRQLDAIEDALEGLEALDSLEALGLDEASTERLDAYREVLRVTRDAMPMEAPAAGLLDGVLAEARAAAGSSKSTATSSTKPVENKRFSWVPWLAFAASAAAVLWFIRPPADGVEGSEPTLAMADDAKATAEKEDAAPSSVVAKDDARAAAEAEPAEEVPAAEELAAGASRPGAPVEPAAALPTDGAAPKKKRSRSDAKPKAIAEDLPEETKGPLPDKDTAWDDLTRAHSQRRRGECRSAKSLYRTLTTEGLSATVRGQAYAGLGLCEEFDGVSASASTHYASARKLVGDIDGWIAAEREEMHSYAPAPSRAKKSASSSSKSKTAPKADVLEASDPEMMDPFGD